MGGFAERLAWSPVLADFYHRQPEGMENLTPAELAGFEDDLNDVVKRRGLGAK